LTVIDFEDKTVGRDLVNLTIRLRVDEIKKQWNGAHRCAICIAGDGQLW
jgi:hypothetical protein